MATSTLTPPPLVGAPGTTKRRAKRLGYVTASLLALVAIGIAIAYFLTTKPYAGNDATGGELVVDATGLPLSADDLFPTSAADGGTNAREGAFTVNNTNPASVAYTMTATCDNCGDGGPEQTQWEDLRIIVADAEGNELYRGRLADMNDGFQAPSSALPNPLAQPGTPAGGPVELGTADPQSTAGYTTRIWLAETGEQQEQSVLSTWTFDIEARTV